MTTATKRQQILDGISARLQTTGNKVLLGSPVSFKTRYEPPNVIAEREDLPRINIIPLMASGDYVTMQVGVNKHEFPVTIIGWYRVEVEDYDTKLHEVNEWADNCLDMFSGANVRVCGAAVTEAYVKVGAHAAGDLVLLWFAVTLMVSGMF